MTHKPTTLITGSGRRVGEQIARHLAARGHDLVLHYHRSKDAAEALAGELRATSHKPRITLVHADLENLPECAAFWDGLPPVTNLIHNASRYTRDRLADFSVSDLRAHLAVNLEAPLILTQGFVRQLPNGVSGNVLVLGDGTLGWSISPEFFSYAVSKHAWSSLIDVLAAAVAPRVRANVIALAPTLPGVNDPEGMFERLAEHAPLKRTGDVAEVLAAIDFLLNSPGITGQVISLGNGMGLTSWRG
jgi:NAD(P)-dependent dehydrogenase (short-subunit alcohol dehydrogenase family)